MTNLSTLEVIAGIATAAASIAGAWIVAKFSSKASRESTKVDARRADREDWESIRSALRDELNEVRSDRNEDRARIDTLEGTVRQQGEQIVDLRDRLTATQRLFNAAQMYVQRLLDFIADNLPGVEVPEPPPDLTDHLPSSSVDDWRTPPPSEDS